MLNLFFLENRFSVVENQFSVFTNLHKSMLLYKANNCVGIYTLPVNFPCSPCIVQSSYTTKQMHEFIFSGIFSQRYKIFDWKIDFFLKSKTGFQNRKPDFQFSINTPSIEI